MARSTWGSLTKRRNGVWSIRYPLPADLATGKRKQGFETFRGTKRDAVKRLAELRLQLDNLEEQNERVTVSKLWDKSYRPYIGRLSPSTVEGYESAYHAHIEPVFGECELDALQKRDVQAWLDGMSYGAARKAFVVLRAMYSFAVDNDLTEGNLFTKRYRLPNRPRKSASEVAESIHTEKELIELLQAANGEPWEAAFILSAFGGLRREEAFGVKWDDIEFRNGYAVVTVERGLQPAKGGVRVVPLKTGGSYREAVVVEPYSNRLLELADGNGGEEWVCSDSGEPLNPDLASAAYKRWHLNRPYRYVPWKNLRNSYATMLHAKGVDLGTVAKLLGHSTPTITYRNYDRMSAEQLAEAVSALEG